MEESRFIMITVSENRISVSADDREYPISESAFSRLKEIGEKFSKLAETDADIEAELSETDKQIWAYVFSECRLSFQPEERGYIKIKTAEDLPRSLSFIPWESMTDPSTDTPISCPMGRLKIAGNLLPGNERQPNIKSRRDG